MAPTTTINPLAATLRVAPCRQRVRFQRKCFWRGKTRLRGLTRAMKLSLFRGSRYSKDERKASYSSRGNGSNVHHTISKKILFQLFGRHSGVSRMTRDFVVDRL